MEQKSSQRNETEKKGSIGKYIRTAVIVIGVIFILLTFGMAVYRKFGG